MNDTPQNSLKGRRFHPFRFTLCAIFVATAIASTWVAFNANAARRQQALVANLSEMQIIVHYDHQYNALPTHQLALRRSRIGRIADPNQRSSNLNAPPWWRRLIGDHYFQTASAVTISTNELSDIETALSYLKQLPNLREVLLVAPSCIHSIPTHTKAKELLRRELPNVKLTALGASTVG